MTKLIDTIQWRDTHVIDGETVSGELVYTSQQVWCCFCVNCLAPNSPARKTLTLQEDQTKHHGEYRDTVDVLIDCGGKLYDDDEGTIDPNLTARIGIALWRLEFEEDLFLNMDILEWNRRTGNKYMLTGVGCPRKRSDTLTAKLEFHLWKQR